MNFMFRIGCSMSAVLLFAALFTPVARGADVATEHAVKAAVVTKIAKFVSWPDGALGDNGEPIRFCVTENRSFREALAEFENHPIGGRPMSVALVTSPAEVADRCDVLYMSDESERDPAEWLAPISQRPILTFGESSDLSIVTITIRRKKVRFSINLEASKRAGLDVGAQLLQLASLTNGRGS